MRVNQFVALVLVTQLLASPEQVLAQETQGEEKEASDQETLATVSVTGSRVPRQHLESNSPMVSLGADDFQLSAETNVVRELNQIPTFSANRSPVDGVNDAFSGSYLDLRGLGPTRTLTLVNGRRWINTISQGYPDISNIPVELIERVDVLTGGASATYGSDAAAGVVNFILKTDFDGLEVNAQSGITDRGETTNSRFAITGGARFAGTRGGAFFHMSYDDTGLISGADRSFLNPTVINQGGLLVPETSPRLSSGGVSLDNTGLNIAYFDQNGELFNSGGGFNIADRSDLFNNGPYSFVQRASKKYTAMAGADFALHDRVKLYLEGTFFREQQVSYGSPNSVDLSSYSIATDNPFVGPQTQAYFAGIDGSAADRDARAGWVTVAGLSRRWTELGPTTIHIDRDSFRLMAAVEVTLGDGWSWETSAVYAQSNADQPKELNFTDNQRLAQALGAIPGPNGPVCAEREFGFRTCVPINIFGEGKITPDAANFVRQNVILLTNNTDTIITSVVAKPDILQLPAGPVGVAFGAERRENTASEFPDDGVYFGSGSFGGFAGFEAGLIQTEGFSELLVPLLADKPLAKRLGLELGARYTAFNPGETAWTYKALIDWAPVESEAIRFRGGYQRATVAPNPFQVGGFDVFTRTISDLAPTGDPCFTGAPLTGDLRTACIATGVPAAVADSGGIVPAGFEFRGGESGGDLDPEISESLTAGVVLSDLPIDRMNLTIDYYDIKITNMITGAGPSLIFNRCYFSGTGGTDALCNTIDRNPQTGLLDFFNFSKLINGGELAVSGIDFGVSYSRDVPIGLLGVNFIGSRILERESRPDPANPAFVRDCNGLYGSPCGRPNYKSRAHTTFSWARGAVSAGLTWNWLDSVRDSTVIYDPAFAARLATTKIDSINYFDMNVAWGVTDRIEVRAGVSNILDEQPPVVGRERSRNNIWPDYYDAIGRRFFLGAKVTL